MTLVTVVSEDCNLFDECDVTGAVVVFEVVELLFDNVEVDLFVEDTLCLEEE